MCYCDMGNCNSCNVKKGKKIKVSTVCFEKTIRSVNDIVISAPIGIDIDDCTGKLLSKTHIEIISKPCLCASVENNVLVVEGLLHVKITFENPKPCPCTDELESTCQEVFVPIQAVCELGEKEKICENFCDECFNFETQTKVVSTSIFGYPNKDTTVSGRQINLILKAVLDITIYLLQDEIINVNC